MTVNFQPTKPKLRGVYRWFTLPRSLNRLSKSGQLPN